MGALTDIPQTPDAQRKFSYDVLVQDVAESSSPWRSVTGERYHEVASPLDRNNGVYHPLKAEEALDASAIDPEKDITIREKDSYRLLEPDDARHLSSFPLSENERPPPAYSMPLSSLPQSRTTTKPAVPNRTARFCKENRSCLWVIISSLFASAMTLFAKLLELGGGGMHPFQILFMRMVVTTIGCTAYLWWKRVPNPLLGQKGTRRVLFFRGASGFFGIFGMWTSIQFLNLADATVITFLTPTMAGLFSAIFLHQPYSRKEQLASLTALIGVIFIARPSFLFSFSSYPPSGGRSAQPVIEVTPVTTVAGDGHPTTQASSMGEETAARRLTGILLALLSALGSAGAFIAIKRIGDRAHVLTISNVFAAHCTVISTAALAMAPLVGYGQPQLRFGLPQDSRQWVLVSAITSCGFLTQLCLTMGLSSEGKLNKAPAMIYTGMLWTVGFDRWVFGQNMYWSSLLGCALIVGSAVWIILMPKPEDRPKETDDIEK